MRGTVSEQPPGTVNEFDGILVGIHTFGERAGPQDIEPETGITDLVGIQKIQHVTDGKRGASRQVVEESNLSGSYVSMRKVLEQQVRADQAGIFVPSFRICKGPGHIFSTFFISQYIGRYDDIPAYCGNFLKCWRFWFFLDP